MESIIKSNTTNGTIAKSASFYESLKKNLKTKKNKSVDTTNMDLPVTRGAAQTETTMDQPTARNTAQTQTNTAVQSSTTRIIYTRRRSISQFLLTETMLVISIFVLLVLRETFPDVANELFWFYQIIDAVIDILQWFYKMAYHLIQRIISVPQIADFIENVVAATEQFIVS